MNNKNLVKDLSNKNNPIMNRHSSLDSTKSSLRVKKIKLYKEFTPFKITKNPKKKNILDYPIFLSLFTKNCSLSEKNKIKNNSTNNINLNYLNLKNNINKQNELLLLPKTKKIISRNEKGLLIHSFSPINSIEKYSILNKNNFSIQSPSNISKPLVKKLKYYPLLINFNKNKDTEIQILKNYNYNINNNSISNSTFEQDISAIKSSKNTAGKIIYDININDKNKLNMNYQFFTSRDNGGKKENIILPSTKLNIKEINKIKENTYNEEINNKNNLNNISKTLNNKFHKFNRLENISDLLGINKNKNILVNNNNIISTKTLNAQSNIINKYNKIKDESKKILPNQKNSQENKKNKIKNKEIAYPKNLIIEKEKLKKIKEAKFYSAINNKKTMEKYNNNLFLNDLNKVLTKNSINNKINTKIFLNKTQILINAKDLINKINQKQENKLKQIEAHPLTEIEKEKIMSKYINDIYNNKKKLIKYYGKNMFLIKINFYFNCSIHYTLRDYIFSTTQFGEVSIVNKSKKNYNKQGSVRQNIKSYSKDIDNFKRQNTYLPTKRISINNGLEEAFIKKKTISNIQKYLKIKNNPGNLITIQNCILKSLPYYNERYYYYIRKDLEFSNKNNKKGTLKKKKFDFRSFTRHISKKLEENQNQNLDLNSSKILIKILKKKNTFNLSQKTIGTELLLSKKLIKRSPTLLNIEDFTKNLKNQLSQRSRNINIDDYSILQRKNFFKKKRVIKRILSKKDMKDTEKEIKDLNNNKNNNKEDLNDEKFNYEEIYFELIKFIIEGKNKSFEKYFEKNKKYIEINQELYDGNTLLILCAKEGNYYITKYLCEQKAEVNWQNHGGNTALHYAVGKQFYAIADILTRYGAREDIKNIKGLTPWDCIEHIIE